MQRRECVIKKTFPSSKPNGLHFFPVGDNAKIYRVAAADAGIIIGINDNKIMTRFKKSVGFQRWGNISELMFAHQNRVMQFSFVYFSINIRVSARPGITGWFFFIKVKRILRAIRHSNAVPSKINAPIGQGAGGSVAGKKEK